MLDVRMAVGRGLATRIVERPGRTLPPAEASALMADLRAVAAATLPAGELDYGVLGGDPARLQDTVVTVVYERRTRRPIAFNVLTLMDAELRGQPLEVLHLGLVMVDPTVRSRGLSATLYGLTCMLLFLERQGRPLWLSSVTQVPAVVGMVAETFSDVFPAGGARRSFDHLLLARQIMARHRHVFGVGAEAGFDEQRFVITDAYTGGSDALKKSFEAAPKHRRGQFNDFCARELDYGRGDDVLQIGRIDMQAAARYAARVAPPATGLGLAAMAGLSLVRTAVLPVVHWLADDQPYGILRPWRAK
ncbi:hypothetical protein [Phenylobacterium sp.]|jgi:hypothetical protein|uniref:hypothetical protein n=1 Tax=Phenylobacterium sp. TaxID=1871053 RepID=UPI002F94C731